MRIFLLLQDFWFPKKVMRDKKGVMGVEGVEKSEDPAESNTGHHRAIL